jgi:hypothetical protein
MQAHPPLQQGQQAVYLRQPLVLRAQHLQSSLVGALYQRLLIPTGQVQGLKAVGQELTLTLAEGEDDEGVKVTLNSHLDQLEDVALNTLEGRHGVG